MHRLELSVELDELGLFRRSINQQQWAFVLEKFDLCEL